jgi:hypothetical protein
MPRYSVKVFPGVRIYGGHTHFPRRLYKSNSGPTSSIAELFVALIVLELCLCWFVLQWTVIILIWLFQVLGVALNNFLVWHEVRKTRRAKDVAAARSPGVLKTATVEKPGRIDEVASYGEAYSQVTQECLASLATVDTPEAASRFVSQAAQQIRELAAKVPEFYVSECFGRLQDAIVSQSRSEQDACKRELSEASAQTDHLNADLRARFDAAWASGDREAEHALWQERETEQAKCQTRVDAVSRRSELGHLRLDAFDSLGTLLGVWSK